MKRNMIKKSKGFTLIELLIVIGILAVLAVTLLLALNPAEAQKRTRDTKRLRDAATLQAIINQYLESGRTINGDLIQTGGVNSYNSSGNAPQPCTAANNWLEIDVCAYTQTVPRDPNNSQSRTFLSGLSNNFTTIAGYAARVVGSDYEIDVRIEAEANRAMLSSDNGDNTGYYEIYSGLNSLIN
jgi:prepilin-type N-terminal cleavage/methylation domain-containing protein